MAQDLRQGFGLIAPAASNTAPASAAVFSYRQDNVLVSEAGVPATRPTTSALAYAVVGLGLDTGLAIANPNDRTANVTVQLRSDNGDLLGYPVRLAIPGHGHKAGFLDGKDLFGSSAYALSGTMILSSDIPVAAVALRQRTTVHGSLFATLPFVDLKTSAQAGTVILPHVASGGGYQTEVILINLGSDATQATISFFQQDGQPAKVLSFGTEARSQYTTPPIPAGGVVRLTTLSAAKEPISGYAVATPLNPAAALAGLAIFSYFDNGLLTTEASVPATTAARSFRIYVNESFDRWSGLAIANPGSQTANLQLTLNSAAGTALTGATLQIPAGRQIAQFAWQMLSGLEEESPGVLEVTSDVPVYPLALRLRVNERDEVLLTTLPVADMGARRSTDAAVFPQIALGEGWNTEVVIVNSATSAQNGTISFFDEGGSQFSLSDDSGGTSYQLAAGAATRILSLRGGLIGSSVIAPSGGTLSAAGDERFVFAAGTFQTNTKVSVGSLAGGQIEDLLNFKFGSAGLDYLAGFKIESGNARYANALKLSFGNTAGLDQDTQVLIVSVIPDVSGDGMPDLTLVDAGVWNSGRLESQSTAPLPGMRSDGEYLLLSATTPIAFVAGSVTNEDGTPAQDAAVTSFEQPRVFARTDSSGNYLLAVSAPGTSSDIVSTQGNVREYSRTILSPETRIGSAALGAYTTGPPFTVTLTAAASARQSAAFLSTEVIPGPIPGTLARPLPLQKQPLPQYLRELCTNPDADLRKKLAEWLEPVQSAIEGLDIPRTVDYYPLSTKLDCQQKTVPLTAHLYPAVAPERANWAIEKVLNSKISMTKWLPWTFCLTRTIQIAEAKFGAIGIFPHASSSYPAVADVISNKVTSGGDVTTTVEAVAPGPLASITGSISLVEVGFDLSYKVSTCAEEEECRIQVKTDDDLAFELDFSGKPIQLGPAYVTVGDMTGCTQAKKPTISLSPGSLEFSGQESGPNTPDQYLTVKNSGPPNSTLYFSISTPPSWLKLEGPLTELHSGESSTFRIFCSLAGLKADTYRFSLEFTDPNATNSPQSVPVTLTVTGTGKPILQVSPSTLTFSVQQGGSNPAAQTVNVSATGGSLAWTAVPDSSWLRVSPGAGNTPSTLTVSVDLGVVSAEAQVSAGPYSGRVTLTAPGAANSPVTITVTLTITAVTGTALQVNPASLKFNAEVGGVNPPLSQDLHSTSTGGTLNWTAVSGSPWIIILPSGGATPSDAHVSVNVSGLATGTYDGDITIFAAGATNNPVVVAVSLLVADQSSGPLTFTAPAQLASATVGVRYQYSFCQGARPNEACGGPFNPSTSPTGGLPPYHFELDTMGGFPPFSLVMDINGLLSGTPTAAGTSTFRPCAVDLAGARACQTVSLTVTDSGGRFTGSFNGSTTDSSTFSSCIMRHSLSATLTFTISGSGTASAPYTGTVTGNGTDVLTVAQGTYCYGDTISAAISGTVSGSAGRVQASATASAAGTTITLGFSDGVISGNTLTIGIRITNEFFDAPITGSLTLNKAP